MDRTAALNQANARLFSQAFCAELKQEIKDAGTTQYRVAKATGHDPADMSRWLNVSPAIPLTVAAQVCDAIGVTMTHVTAAAYRRLKAGADDDAAARAVMKSMTLAALKDPHKHDEANGEQY